MTREQQIAKQCNRILELVNLPPSAYTKRNIDRSVDLISDYLQMPCGCGCDCKHLKRCPHNKD